MTRITPEEVENFIALYQSGKNTPEISLLTGRSLRAVCYSLKNAGIELRAEQPTQTPRHLEDKAVEMYADGYLRSEIATALSTEGGTVDRILRRRTGEQPKWDDPERQAKRVAIWGNPANQPFHSTPETEALILSLYHEGTGWNDIAAAAQVSGKTVTHVLGRHGVKPSRQPKLNGPQRLQILTMLADRANIAAISSAAGITEDGARKFTMHGRPSLFRSIDTPEKAYWLGFLTADGAILGVNPGTLRLQVCLARKDRGHLVKLREFIGAGREVVDYEAETIGGVVRPYSRFTCQVRPVVMDLARNGILPNKTGHERAWNGPEHLMPHFWRGMVDGDGSVPGKSFSLTLVGSYDVTSAFALWAASITGTGVKPGRDKRSPDHWRTGIGGRLNVTALVRLLYEGAPVSLDRKQALADLVI